MKAAIVERPGVLDVRDIPVPEISDYEALCEILYGATCTGTDWHLINGNKTWDVKYPAVLGHESVGRVIKLGKKVKYLKAGDIIARVGTKPTIDGKVQICYGGFAEYGVASDFKAMEEDGLKFNKNKVSMQIPLPLSIDPKVATMLITWRETLSYITRMGNLQGKSVLVLGSGGNGLAFGVHAKNLKAKRVAMIGSLSRKDLTLKAGIDSYFDYRSDAGNLSIGTFDFIIDAVGKAGELVKFLNLLNKGGTIGIYGLDDFGKVTINPAKAKGTFTVYNNDYDESETHAQTVEFVLKGSLKAEYWMDLDNPYPLERIVDAYETVKNKQAIKVLISIKK